MKVSQSVWYEDKGAAMHLLRRQQLVLQDLRYWRDFPIFLFWSLDFYTYNCYIPRNFVYSQENFNFYKINEIVGVSPGTSVTVGVL